MKIDKKTSKILIVFGTRPEAIKILPVYELLKSCPRFAVEVFFTGQSPDLAQTRFGARSIDIDHRMEVTRGESLTSLFGRVLSEAGDILSSSRFEYVLVQGDTSSAFAGALAGFAHNVEVVHLEAGLRTYDLLRPFPEEGFRQCISRLTSFHFCPTEMSANNLASENVGGVIEVTGNTVIDAIHGWMADKHLAPVEDLAQLYSPGPKQDLPSLSDGFVLVTAHRRESIDSGIANICEAINRLAQAHPEVAFVFVKHKNPEVTKIVDQVLKNQANVVAIEPLDYELFLKLLSECLFAISDSGGIQEEVTALGKLLLVTREVTERPEGLATGHLRLTGLSSDVIFQEADSLLSCGLPNLPSESPYGDGRAARRIVERLTCAINSA